MQGTGCVILDSRVGLGSPLCQADRDQGCFSPSLPLSLFQPPSTRPAFLTSDELLSHHTRSLMVLPDFQLAVHLAPHAGVAPIQFAAVVAEGSLWKGRQEEGKSVTLRPRWESEGFRLFTGKVQLVLENKVRWPPFASWLFQGGFFHQHIVHPPQQVDVASGVTQGYCTSFCLFPDKEPGHQHANHFTS